MTSAATNRAARERVRRERVVRAAMRLSEAFWIASVAAAKRTTPRTRIIVIDLPLKPLQDVTKACAALRYAALAGGGKK